MADRMWEVEQRSAAYVRPLALKGGPLTQSTPSLHLDLSPTRTAPHTAPSPSPRRTAAVPTPLPQQTQPQTQASDRSIAPPNATLCPACAHPSPTQFVRVISTRNETLTRTHSGSLDTAPAQPDARTSPGAWTAPTQPSKPSRTLRRCDRRRAISASDARREAKCWRCFLLRRRTALRFGWLLEGGLRLRLRRIGDCDGGETVECKAACVRRHRDGHCSCSLSNLGLTGLTPPLPPLPSLTLDESIRKIQYNIYRSATSLDPAPLTL
jgi:hypothetical protein